VPPPGAPAAPAAGWAAAPDPYGLGPAALRLSGGSRKHGKAALAVLNAVLKEGDQVEQVLLGRYHNVEGAAALVSGDLLLVNVREWEPEVVRVPLAGMGVQGLADGKLASLQFQSGETRDSFEGVADTDLAVEFAQRLRQRSAGG
jgi:hypothetical protein